MSRIRPLARRAGAVLACAAAAGAIAAPAAAESVSREAGAGVAARYWTEARMESARPLPLPQRGGGEAGVGRRNHPIPYSSFEVADPTAFPNSASGKVFGTLRGFGRFECSATVVEAVNRSVIFTAGHCVYDPRLARYAKRLTFVPAYQDGARPFGSWSWSELTTTRQWIRRENYNFDYAAIELGGRSGDGARIADVVGARAIAVGTARDQNYTSIGYPYNISDAQRMRACVSRYGGSDPRPIPRGPVPMAIGCDMKEGASGGGWFDDLGRLVSVNSFGYGKHPDVLYGPYLGDQALRLVARAGS